MTAVEARPAPPREPGRAGRNLPMALAVGLGMGAVVLLTLYTVKAVFLGVVAVAIAVGMVELVRGLGAKDFRPPVVPLVAGALAIVCTSYALGRDAMTDALVLTVPVLVFWRAVRGTDGMVADVGSGLLALVYVGFLAGFAGLLLAGPHGAQRETCFVATVVASDVGGYAAGVLAGRHPMAPTISPKKSWEGLAGSALLCAVVGLVLVVTLLHAQWWQGVLFGLAIVTSATLGDLGESMLKRDLGVKDMGTLLPGHGGLMDRLDSLLPSAPVAWAVLFAIAPVHT